MTEYSLVIPVKDEEGNLEKLFSEIKEVMEAIESSWEALFIDDGSTDGSLAILKKMQRHNPEIKLIVFDKNYGQSAAFYAGFKQSRFPWVITLDADLQNDPKDIPNLIALRQDADLVVGWRKERKDPWQKKVISKISNKIRSKFLNDHIHDSGCSLKLMRREALLNILPFKGMHRFLPALFLMEGYKVKEVEVRHHPRHLGKTKYHFFNRSLRPIIDLLGLIWIKRRKLVYKVKADA